MKKDSKPISIFGYTLYFENFECTKLEKISRWLEVFGHDVVMNFVKIMVLIMLGGFLGAYKMHEMYQDDINQGYYIVNSAMEKKLSAWPGPKE